MKELGERGRDHSIGVRKLRKRRPTTSLLRFIRKIFTTVIDKGSCAVCGESNPACLDYHHKNPEEKLFPICTAYNHSVKEVLAEIEKCEVLCANCHRKLHAGVISSPNAQEACDCQAN
jgi:hypothetical protein